ncbi:Smr/MutS family protein [Psychrobacter sp. FDAARGOS_221]|uniref:Smr/MutS family protein n=1 Tax=Psychrobacter sp. FDAARGOS_221 TaxID=1975705 RepID=UPI000BB5779A|nr:Smr/MutS family protein [Psychrobacter sp. FDAARGOS_221]PNK60003.1 DNA mismatch repair protein MutS [Psychrobacter sp. FDAARGOS_221]
MANSLFSKEMQDQLKELKSELSKGRPTSPNDPENEKPTDPVALPTKKQVEKTVKQLDSEHIDDDKVLFMQAMAGVQPIKDNNTVSEIAKPKVTKPDAATLSKRAAAQGEDSDSLEAGLSDMQALLNPVSGDAYLVYKNPTLQNKVFNQLKQGKLRWYDAVDIHGCTIDEAREAMTTLIAQAKTNNESVVKIVHGKGSDAVLKTCVNGWLRQLPEVLGFCSAPPKDGGNGAVLVLLKKNKNLDA